MIEHLQIETGAIDLHLAVAGSGPLIVMCHGYPGLWYSWRHQIPALVEAGFRVAALDMRGYGRSSRPRDFRDYGFDSLSADVLAVLDHFGEDQAILFGHDFGANLTWHMGIHHSDRIRAIAPLCVPYDMELSGGCDVPPSELFASIAAKHFFHMHYYQLPGIPERHVRGREREFLTRLFWALSAKGELLNWENFPMEGTSYVDVLGEAPALPWPWLSEQDMDYYVSEYLSAGPDLTITGGANSYRVMDYNWQLFRDSAHAQVQVPTLWVGGEDDPVTSLAGEQAFDRMRDKVKDLRGLELLPDAGHFIQQEAPEALNRLLLEFVVGL